MSSNRCDAIAHYCLNLTTPGPHVWLCPFPVPCVPECRRRRMWLCLTHSLFPHHPTRRLRLRGAFCSRLRAHSRPLFASLAQRRGAGVGVLLQLRRGSRVIRCRSSSNSAGTSCPTRECAMFSGAAILFFAVRAFFSKRSSRFFASRRTAGGGHQRTVARPRRARDQVIEEPDAGGFV
jgi:hypothetical protein